MGLRVNTNIPSITALRTLRQADSAQRKSLERLSTGLRINRASDDPSGLVISEQLRAQTRSMGQALENSQNASNLLSTSEAALSEVSSLLLGIRESIIFALNTGGNDTDQIAAEQDSIDNALSSIDRVAQTTKFGSRKLLDGSSGLVVRSMSAQVSGVNIQNIAFDGQSSQQFTMNITGLASRATLISAAGAYAAGGASNATIRISGADGTQDITIASSFTVAQFNDAVNRFTSDTGVYASGGRLFSVEFGSEQTISLETISGTLNALGGLDATDGVQLDSGRDVQGYVNGMSFDAQGNLIHVVSDVLTADIRMSDGTDGKTATTVAATQTFTVRNTGLTFQLNQSATLGDREQVGLRSIHTSNLGFLARTVKSMGATSMTVGGFLSSLESGSANDLNTNASNALRIVDEAINQVTDVRSYMGGFQANTVDTNIRSLSVALENLTASESSIRDLDFAEETANFTKNQILFQSGIAVLAQSNLISQSVLTLLG